MKTPSKYYSLETSGKSAEIMIYGDVTSWPWLESDVSAYNLSKQIQELDVDEIVVGINSYGGEVAEGLAIYNSLKNHKARITTRVDGFACSIASVIFAAGDKRIMNDASLLMIHNAWTFASGNAAELRKQADDLDKINDASVKAYMAVANIEESEIREIMDGESWLDPEEAKEIGLATEIVETESDKPSQSVRKKVFQMLKNPYMLETDEEEPETDQDTGESGEEGEQGGDSAETDVETDDSGESGEDSGDSDENGDNSAETDENDPENDENARQLAFFNAISAI